MEILPILTVDESFNIVIDVTIPTRGFGKRREFRRRGSGPYKEFGGVGKQDLRLPGPVSALGRPRDQRAVAGVVPRRAEVLLQTQSNIVKRPRVVL